MEINAPLADPDENVDTIYIQKSCLSHQVKIWGLMVGKQPFPPYRLTGGMPMQDRKLDQQTIKQLLREADDQWYKTHGSSYNYQEHLDFQAAYIVRNYNQKRKLAEHGVQSGKKHS